MMALTADSAAAPRVLVIDDDATVRVLMRGALRRLGFDVALADGGHEGLMRFAEQGADMVMLDVDMPDLSGMDVCRILREQAGELLPIVMVTGMEDVASVEEAYRSGATDFIAKPINWTLLGHRVQYLMRSAKAMSDVRAMHGRTAALLDAFPDLMMRVNARGVVLEVRRGQTALGVRAERAVEVGDSLGSFLPEPSQAALFKRLRRTLDTGQTHDAGFTYPGADGSTLHFEVRMARIDAEQVLCLVRDVTQSMVAQAALVRSESRLEQAQALARIGSWHLDLESRVLEWSTQTVEMFGLPISNRMTHAEGLAMVHPDDLPRLLATVEQAVKTKRSYSCEYRAQSHGRSAWLHENGRLECDADGRVKAIYGTIQDITERKEAEARIAHLAYFDSLTGMPNRASFLERLVREVNRIEASGGQGRLALLFMDLDGFKAVNDTLGHHAGDRLLQMAADRLRSLVRAGDVLDQREPALAETDLARLGGDEFTALLLDLRDLSDALAVGQRILEALRHPFVIDGRAITLSASVGVAVYPEDGHSAEELLKHADTAMYHAKELGRDNCQFYSHALTRRALERMNMARDLRTALDEGQFELAYQPQVEATTGKLCGVEALIRWRHPQQGPISPAAFIPLAESMGLINLIGRWVLREACRTAMHWQRPDAPLRLAVNLSPVQLRDPELVDFVLQTLADAGMAAGQLELEVTEGTLMEDNAPSRAALAKLHAAGVRLALDDFGTGYSSMGYLKRMPVAMLKVDRSFVQGLPEDRDNRAIVRAIVSLAHSMGFAVTAEGVETAAQAKELAALGCDLLQGYHIGVPMAAAQFSTWLGRHRASGAAPQSAAL